MPRRREELARFELELGVGHPRMRQLHQLDDRLLTCLVEVRLIAVDRGLHLGTLEERWIRSYHLLQTNQHERTLDDGLLLPKRAVVVERRDALRLGYEIRTRRRDTLNEFKNA